MKRLNHKAVALATVLVGATAQPALAQISDLPMMPTQPRTEPTTSNVNEQPTMGMMENPIQDAFHTVTPALTFSREDDARAALTYMDDGVGLMRLAQLQIKAGDTGGAQISLIGASGKLTTAFLLNFRDRDFSQNTWPLTLQIFEASDVVLENPQQALSTLNDMQPQIAAIARTQFASLQGGGGGGPATDTIGNWEPLNFLTAYVAPEQ